MEILWACDGEHGLGRLEWARSAATGIRLTVNIRPLSAVGTSMAEWHAGIEGVDLVVADFCTDDGALKPDVVAAATVGRHCSAKPTYILTDDESKLPFDWMRHGQLVKVMAGMAGRHDLQSWLRGAVLKAEHSRGRPLVDRRDVLPPEVFVAMPFQGYVPAALPERSAFDFSRFLRCVEEASASISSDPRPVVTIVGRDGRGGDILDNVEERIASAAIVLADFSPDHRSRPFPNPNVVTEATMARVGYGHEATLLLCAQHGTPLPAVWRTFQTTFYDPVTLETSDALSLAEALRARIARALELAKLRPSVSGPSRHRKEVQEAPRPMVPSGPPPPTRGPSGPPEATGGAVRAFLGQLAHYGYTVSGRSSVSMPAASKLKVDLQKTHGLRVAENIVLEALGASADVDTTVKVLAVLEKCRPTREQIGPILATLDRDLPDPVIGRLIEHRAKPGDGLAARFLVAFLERSTNDAHRGVAMKKLGGGQLSKRLTTLERSISAVLAAPVGAKLRRQALRTLGRVKPTQSAADLAMQYLDDPDQESRRQALLAYQRLAPPDQAFDAIASRIDTDDNAQVRAGWVGDLLDLDLDRAVAWCKRVLAAPKGRMRVADAIAFTAAKECVDSLRDAVEANLREHARVLEPATHDRTVRRFIDGAVAPAGPGTSVRILRCGGHEQGLEVTSLADSPHGERIAVGLSNGACCIVRAGHSSPSALFKGSGRSTRDVSLGSEMVCVLDVSGEVWLHHLDSPSGGSRVAIPASAVASANRVSLAADGSAIVLGGEDGRLLVWDVAIGRERMVMEGSDSECVACWISTGGARVWSAHVDGRMYLRDGDGQILKQVGLEQQIVTAAVSAQGKAAAVAATCTGHVWFWDILRDKAKGAMEHPEHRPVGIVFEPRLSLVHSLDTSGRLVTRSFKNAKRNRAWKSAGYGPPQRPMRSALAMLAGRPVFSGAGADLFLYE